MEQCVCEETLPIEIKLVNEVVAREQSRESMNLILVGSIHRSNDCIHNLPRPILFQNERKAGGGAFSLRYSRSGAWLCRTRVGEVQFQPLGILLVVLGGRNEVVIQQSIQSI